MNGDVHVSLERTDFLAVFPLKGEGRVRLVGTVRDQAAREQDKLDWSDVSKGVIESVRINVERVNWFSTYRVHHRVADHFRRGRAFLLGDAAHIHSPVGGQGMNTGIGDAIALMVIGEGNDAGSTARYSQIKKLANSSHVQCFALLVADHALIGGRSEVSDSTCMILPGTPKGMPMMLVPAESIWTRRSRTS